MPGLLVALAVGSEPEDGQSPKTGQYKDAVVRSYAPLMFVRRIVSIFAYHKETWDDPP